MSGIQKIVPCLWFDKETEEAVNFYVSVFNSSPHQGRDSRLLSITRYEKGMEVPGADEMEGKVLTAIFELSGQRYMALDGGPIFKFNEAVSFYLECEDQQEVDYFRSKLSAVSGGRAVRLDQGPVWPFLADCPQADGRPPGQPRQEEVVGRNECNAEDEEDRDRGSPESIRRSLRDEILPPGTSMEPTRPARSLALARG
jgi:predicted 3-demethylubiquinone-9 3-methyltransferase (glyoxalase superfamily)